MIFKLDRSDCRIERYAAQRYDHANTPEQFKLSQEVRSAIAYLVRQGFVVRRRAMNDSRDVAVCEPKAVTTMNRRWLVGEPCAVQRAVEPISAAVAREHAARPIPSMRGGRET